MPRTSRLPAPAAPTRKTAQLPRAVEDHVRAAIEACDRGELMTLTPAELEEARKTGELPERVYQWADSSD
jgi:hypothetical protein